ncbi:MAG: glutaredoxin family protein [Candidatus Odinarchaeia archaeon]
MQTNLKFSIESGSRRACKIIVYTLSTCGFCRRAINFLKNKYERILNIIEAKEGLTGG